MVTKMPTFSLTPTSSLIRTLVNSDNPATNKWKQIIHSFISVVLKRFPDDDDGRLLLESINTIILERKKGAEGAKKKTSKRVDT